MNKTIVIALVTGAIAAPASAQFPTSPPPPLELREISFPEFQETVLDNGMRLVVVEDRSLPIISVQITMPAGAVSDPRGLEGLASMTATLLDKGTTTRSAEEIAETIEAVGGFLSSGAGNDFFTVSTTVLSDDIQLGFELLADVTLNPTFPVEELNRERERGLSALRLQNSQPASIASRTFFQHVYGDHPYGRSQTEESLQALTRDRVVRFHQEQLGPTGALMVVTGDINLREARSLARNHFGTWTGGAMAGTPGRPAQMRPTVIVLVHRPGSDQATVRVGNIGFDTKDPDYFAAVIGNQILGGSPDARLFAILREEKGYTYGAYSGMARRRGTGYFQATADVRNEVADSALSELLYQLERIRTEPVTDEELTAAKSNLIGSFPRSIETPQQIASQISTTILLDLGREYLDTYLGRLDAVTKQDVMRAARRLIKPDSAWVVVVGDASELFDRLEAIAPIRLVDIDGNELTPEQLTATPAVMQASRIETGTSTYRVLLQDNPVGTRTFTVSTDDNSEFVATKVTELPNFGVRQTSEVRFTEGMRPLYVNQSGNVGPNHLETEVVYDGWHATGTGQAPSPGGVIDTVDVDATLDPGTIDSEMLEILLPTIEYEAGATLTVPFFDANDGSTNTATLVVGEMINITVPAGSFDVFPIDVSGGDQPQRVYITTTAPYRLVRTEIVGQPVVFELE